ncbi:glutamate-rich protein 2 isoform X2 [Mesocricetus auratus]|uniref:Glutamate-rich protein 2 isoform X2 n=1 Tax=Mesocricetus auratus TaxID=10036 RepID=A0ABM2XFB1_MESAU|nr:glutamate-rich protein 2 isoform X2 [Mesocricetus auratus]
MDTDLPVPLSPAFLKVTRVRAQVCPRVFAPNLPRSVTPQSSGRWATRAVRPALRVVPTGGPAPAPPPARSLRPAPGPPRSAPLAPPLRQAAQSLGGSRGSRGSSGNQSCLHGDAASQARNSEPSVSGERAWHSWSALRGISLAGPPAGWGSGAPRLPRHRPRRKEASSKKIEDKVSLKSTENRPSSRSLENKDDLTNWQSDLWSSSFVKESAGEAVKDAVLVKQEKNTEFCLQDIEEKLSDSTDGDGDDDTNDEDDEGPVKKETRAPLELMAEFLRAEMGRDYQLAKKLCQMILIYEPENPVAKEFFLLIEEILLKEKAQKQEEDEEDSDEDTSSESEAESSEDASDDSSDECEDGS